MIRSCCQYLKTTYLQQLRLTGNDACISGPHSLPLRALINKDIVDIIIGDIMFHPEDMDGITQARLLASFVPTLYSSEDAADMGNVSRYVIIVRNTKHFQFVAQSLREGGLE